jgi:hypothetical protein
VSALVVLGWIAAMGALVDRSYLRASANLAADLARYGSDAQWHGVYYRGEKIGFTVRQTLASGDGFEVQEDGRLQMSLLGATTFTRVRTTAQLDAEFTLRSFEFLLDPGTGPLQIRGTVDGPSTGLRAGPSTGLGAGLALNLEIRTDAGVRTERIALSEPPVLGATIGRRLASAGLKPGATYRWMVLDPATLQNAPLTAHVGERRLIDTAMRRGGRVPAFEVTVEFSGLQATSWITDTGETVREESPLGLITVRETPEAARTIAVTSRGRTDLLEEAAIVPDMKDRVDEPRDVRLLRMRLEGVDLSGFQLSGVNQAYAEGVIEIRDPQLLRPGATDPSASRYLAPERFIESDDPDIAAESERALERTTGTRARAERLVRHVNGLLEKKPTISLPSAREVLRTKVGDCNEHTVLYVALARAAGIPARIATGVAYTRGAFYYHAWPEIYIEEQGQGLWLPVDPTFNQFPADAMHVRFALGGLEKQAAIVPLIGRLKMAVLDLQLTPEGARRQAGLSAPRPQAGMDSVPLPIPMPRRSAGGCWEAPPAAAPSFRR